MEPQTKGGPGFRQPRVSSPKTSPKRAARWMLKCACFTPNSNPFSKSRKRIQRIAPRSGHAAETILPTNPAPRDPSPSVLSKPEYVGPAVRQFTPISRAVGGTVGPLGLTARGWENPPPGPVTLAGRTAGPLGRTSARSDQNIANHTNTRLFGRPSGRPDGRPTSRENEWSYSQMGDHPAWETDSRPTGPAVPPARPTGPGKVRPPRRSSAQRANNSSSLPYGLQRTVSLLGLTERGWAYPPPGPLTLDGRTAGPLGRTRLVSAK